MQTWYFSYISNLLLEISWISNRNLKCYMSKISSLLNTPLLKQNKLPWIVFFISINGIPVCLWNSFPNLEGSRNSFLSITLHVAKFPFSCFSTVNSSQSHLISTLEYGNTLLPYMSTPPSVIYFHGRWKTIRVIFRNKYTKFWLFTPHTLLWFLDWLSVANRKKQNKITTTKKQTNN